MPLYHQIAGQVISDEQWLDTLARAPLGSTPLAGFDTGERCVGTADFLFDKVSGPTGDPVPFKVIGRDLPLMVRLMLVYTGLLPRRGAKRLLVTSSVGSEMERSLYSINTLTVDSVGQRQFIEPSTATAHDSRLVFYKPALTDGEGLIDIRITLAFDDFNERPWQTVSSVMRGLGSIPVFAAASGYLVAGSEIVKIATKTANDWLEGRGDVALNEMLRIWIPGQETSLPGIKIVTPPGTDAQRLGVCYDAGTNQLLKQNGVPYDGDHPIAVLHVDGHEYPSFNGFQPNRASAQLLREYLGIGDDQEKVGEDIVRAAQVANDVIYWRRAQAILHGRAPAALSDNEKTKYEALLRNITNNEFRGGVGLELIQA